MIINLSPRRSPQSPKDLADGKHVVVDLSSDSTSEELDGDDLMKHNSDGSPPKEQHLNPDIDPASLEEHLAADLTSNFHYEPAYYSPPSEASQVKDTMDILTFSVAQIQAHVKELKTSDAEIVASQKILQTKQDRLHDDVREMLKDMTTLKDRLEIAIKLASK
ncbi:hypothetical protein ABFX02_12G019700 [Erythranthe guttata]